LRARKDGKFSSVEDFAKRVSTSKFNKKAWDSLIKSGGFDSLGDRSDLLFNLETVQAFASKLQKEALSGQTDLFGGLLGAAQVQSTVTMQPSPVKHTDRERLTWERELMGLYVSAHPLDNYDVYFEEQTVPLMQVTPDYDGKKATIGGLVSTVRTIITKSGTKMAFVGLEDKTGESEIIVFPNLYEQIGAKLVQDAVIRATGKISARDRDGNLGTDAKMIADEIQFVSDNELNTYESNGRKMDRPKVSAKVKAMRVAAKNPSNMVAAAVATAAKPIIPLDKDIAKKLYVHIKNPDDQDSLRQLKQICGNHPGLFDIILVLGADKKSAVKLPFKVEADNSLVDELVKILGEDSVVIK
jgi:DNA polymerase III subunit alpha